MENFNEFDWFIVSSSTENITVKSLLANLSIIGYDIFNIVNDIDRNKSFLIVNTICDINFLNKVMEIWNKCNQENIIRLIPKNEYSIIICNNSEIRKIHPPSSGMGVWAKYIIASKYNKEINYGKCTQRIQPIKDSSILEQI